MSNKLDGLGLHSKSQPILPLTQEDIMNLDNSQQSQQPDDLVSIANSLQSSSTTLSSFAKRQQRKMKIKNIKRNLESNISMPKYFKRFMNFQSLDFETAVWEMFNLLVQPKRVYKLLYYQRQTKNKWSRDDPSFAIILSLLLTISAICWGLTYSTNIITIFKLILYMVIVDFLLVGLVVATIGWILANNILSQSNTNSQSGSYDSNKWWVNNKYIRFIFPSDSILEWAYCFDVHCNSYLIIWCGLYLIQFFLLPLLRLNNWISCLIGNTLYLASLSYYFVITFYGYNMLPFLTRTEFLLVPIPIFAIFWLILTLSGFNVANYMSDSYFG